MADELRAAPVLSTPAEYALEQHIQVGASEAQELEHALVRSEEELAEIYEIARTVTDIQKGGWRRIALQFPDYMLRDAPRIVQALQEQLTDAEDSSTQPEAGAETKTARRIYILGDTSYSACCVDEVAAEHADADVVVHYGRSCLSPTSRLPVLYVFTKHQLDQTAVLKAFEQDFPDKQTKVVLMADVTRQDHVPSLAAALVGRGYERLLSTKVVHNPSGTIPNRSLVDSQGADITNEDAQNVDLHEYSIFHIADPPTALLLALASRVKELHILPTSATTGSSGTSTSSAQTTRRLLGRRYARLLTLASAGTIGILVNTLSVSNYLASIDNIRKHIAAAGKKSYTMVVGKLNPAKLANFSEIDGWVVVACWESALLEDDGDYFRPVVTPFELEAALAGDDKRIWGHEWWGGIEGVKAPEERPEDDATEGAQDGETQADDTDEEESEPPVFDLRTGKLITQSRPMRVKKGSRKAADNASQPATKDSSALAVRAKSELASIKGMVSPGAEYLRSQRTWQGLGSDFAAEPDASTAIEEGRSGVARGYTVGEDGERR